MSAGSTAPTENVLYGLNFRKRNVTSKGTPDGCKRRSAAPTCFIHPTWRVNGERVNLSWLRHAQVWPIFVSSLQATLIYLHERLHDLEFPSLASLAPASSQGGSFNKLRTLSTRWYLCNNRIKVIPQSVFKRIWPENAIRVVQVIREEDMSWLKGYLSSMFKWSSDNRRMKENVYFNISNGGGHGTDDTRRFAKPELISNVALYLLQKSVQLWDDLWKTEYCARATVETAKSAGSTAHTENILYGLVFRKRNVTSKAMPDGCTRRSAAPFPLAIPHAEWKVNDSLYPDCATLRFGKFGDDVWKTDYCARATVETARSVSSTAPTENIV